MDLVDLALQQVLELRLSVLGDPVDPVDLVYRTRRVLPVLDKNLLEYNLH